MRPQTYLNVHLLGFDWSKKLWGNLLEFTVGDSGFWFELVQLRGRSLLGIGYSNQVYKYREFQLLFRVLYQYSNEPRGNKPVNPPEGKVLTPLARRPRELLYEQLQHRWLKAYLKQERVYFEPVDGGVVTAFRIASCYVLQQTNYQLSLTLISEGEGFMYMAACPWEQVMILLEEDKFVSQDA
ncbi:MAG: hypothetical protein INR73_28635 [Williamsia sp.]|nr:hypothetical protein [Williamsia sp.]